MGRAVKFVEHDLHSSRRRAALSAALAAAHGAASALSATLATSLAAATFAACYSQAPIAASTDHAKWCAAVSTSNNA